MSQNNTVQNGARYVIVSNLYYMLSFEICLNAALVGLSFPVIFVDVDISK